MDFVWSNIFKGQNKDGENSIKLFAKVPIFSELKDRELREFIRISHVRKYGVDETIFWEGEPGVGMYIIHSGIVRITKKSNDAQDQIVLAELKDGDFFGELALLNDTPRSASAVAIEPTEVIGIFRPDLLDLFTRKPALANKVLFKLAEMIGHRLIATNRELNRVKEQLRKGAPIES